MTARRDFTALSDPATNRYFRRRWTAPEPVDDQIDMISRRAVAHWLRQAERLKGEERAIALATAEEIREACGLRWSDLFDHRRAA